MTNLKIPGHIIQLYPKNGSTNFKSSIKKEVWYFELLKEVESFIHSVILNAHH